MIFWRGLRAARSDERQAKEDNMTNPWPKATFATIVMFVALLVIAPPGRAQQEQQAAASLSAAQIEQLVAPIALFPDQLLSQVLMASTYPLEVVEAARWVGDNPKVTGKALEDAMQKQPWDPSVKALTAVPQTLQMMNDQIKWTQNLGDAFLAQQSDVLDAVQRLRARADAAGNLKSTPQQTVTKANRPANVSAGGGAPATAYTIAPTNPEEYYVPIYDPGVVYGDWPYPDYAPFFWSPPGWGGGWWGFGTGFFTGAAIWGGINWWNRNVSVNPLRFNQFNRTNISNTNWAHNAAHRGGVPYANPRVANRFGDQGRGQARDAARQKIAQGGKGQGGMGQGGMGQGGMGGQKIAGGGMGEGGMGGMGQGGMGQGGMGQGGMGQGGMGGQKVAGGGMGGMGGMGGGMAAGGMGGMGGGMAYAGGGGRGGAGMGVSGGGRSFARAGGGGGFRGGGGGGVRAGGGGGRGGGGRGGGRRSDIALKHDIALLGYLDNGIGFYRFAYNGSDTAYVGVMAQELQRVRPDLVVRGRDGYLRVLYDRLGLMFQTYDQWVASGAQIPAVAR
jgi:hypothetical protein